MQIPYHSKWTPPRGITRKDATSRSRASIAALVISCTIWGTAFAFGKVALNELTVSQLVLLRFGFASLTLLPVILARKAWIARKDILHFVFTGFLAVPVTFLLQFHGLSLTTVTRASLIIGAIPPLLALGGAFLLGEKPGRRSWAAIVVSMIGVLVITGSPGKAGSWTGDGLVFLSALISVIWVIWNKRLSAKYGAMVATTYLLLFGTITLAPITLIVDGLPRSPLSVSAWGAALILGIFCSALAFVLWNWGLERLPASTAGIYLNLEPLVGSFLGITIWGEQLVVSVILGGAMIVGAAVVAARTEPTDL